MNYNELSRGVRRLENDVSFVIPANSRNDISEMMRIKDAMRTASQMDIKKFKETVRFQSELIEGIKNDLARLIHVYQNVSEIRIPETEIKFQ